jgi:hypothetical protein
MTIVFTTTNPVICQITLNQSTPTAAIDLSAVFEGPREFVIGDNSVFDGAILTVQRYISSNTGWTNYVSPQTGSVVQITTTGAGRALNWLAKVGQFKFVVTGATSNTQIYIDITK